jgi:hypothetical protein
VYCPQPECSTYIPQANRHPQLAFCPRCSRALCMCCKQTFHYGNCPPDAATQQVLDLAADQGWQPCPSCRTMVELRSGCYHITCVSTPSFVFLPIHTNSRPVAAARPKSATSAALCGRIAIVRSSTKSASLNAATRPSIAR